MRTILPISIVVLLLALLLPLILVSGPAPLAPADEALDKPPAESEPGPPMPDTSDTVEPSTPLQDEAFILQVLLGDEVHAMSMAEFLLGVVAAEMPARFHPEALRAQAVAARTYTLHRMSEFPAARHPGAYVCGSYACCKAFHSPERLRVRWGDRFDYYSAIIADAVRATDGVILLYGGEPILAAFHAASYEYTEASGSIWGSLPYLQSVRTFEGEADVPRFYASVEMSFSQFRDAVRGTFPGAVLHDDNIPYWITEQRYTDAGRLDSLNIGGVTVTGPQFRRLFGLRSTAVRFAFDAQGLTITTGGHGHGVGMSQFGANAMAELGHTYEEILRWYYTNVTIGRMDSPVANLS